MLFFVMRPSALRRILPEILNIRDNKMYRENTDLLLGMCYLGVMIIVSQSDFSVEVTFAREIGNSGIRIFPK